MNFLEIMKWVYRILMLVTVSAIVISIVSNKVLFMTQ